jgi:hypothetical protein
MEYKLYTLVDISHTGQFRSDPATDNLRWKEQNFQTVMQTLGMRANISYRVKPVMITVKGRIVGFNTDEIINIWQFDFYTERDFLFENDGDPVGFLKDDFEMVPYIPGLNEMIEQNYDVFVTYGSDPNIIFYQK